MFRSCRLGLLPPEHRLICRATPRARIDVRLHFLAITSHGPSSEPHPGMPRSNSTYDHKGNLVRNRFLTIPTGVLWRIKLMAVRSAGSLCGHGHRFPHAPSTCSLVAVSLSHRQAQLFTRFTSAWPAHPCGGIVLPRPSRHPQPYSCGSMAVATRSPRHPRWCSTAGTW